MVTSRAWALSMSSMDWVIVWQGWFWPTPQQAFLSEPRSLSTSIVPSAESPEQQEALRVSQKKPPAHCALVWQVARQPASSQI